MFRATALRAIRPVAASRASSRAFSVSSRRFAGAEEHHGPSQPQIYGPGQKNIESIPSDEEQATGLERYQLLGRMEGVDVFDMKPLDSSRLGTPSDPIKVHSFYPNRLVGCTGSPADSHDVIWLRLDLSKDYHRCPECGSAYKLDVEGDLAEHHH